MSILTKSNERPLAFKAAKLVQTEELLNINGGAATGTTQFTTKQTVDTRGNWDVGGDVRWD